MPRPPIPDDFIFQVEIACLCQCWVDHRAPASMDLNNRIATGSAQFETQGSREGTGRHEERRKTEKDAMAAKEEAQKEKVVAKADVERQEMEKL